MTQDELKLVLDALKWCHGGEPCGTAEAIAVVEKALANVATNDTPKEYVDEMQKQRHDITPPQRTWVGLTDEDVKAVNAQVSQIPPIDYTTTTYAKAIEAKLKEKNT